MVLLPERSREAAHAPRSRRCRRQRGMLPLALTALAFLAFSLPPYLSLDPARSRVPPPADVPAYFPALVVHVTCGAVAMVTWCLPIWPWLRRRRPRVHRIVGRVYVLAGVLPSALAGLFVAYHSPFGPVAGASSLVLAPLRLSVTAVGVVRLRQRRVAEHGRWMIRSFALTMPIVIHRLIGVPIFVALYLLLGADDEQLLQRVGAAIVACSSWILALVLVERHLRRDPDRPFAEATPA
ncbi:Predicted membrane protein [Nannocystis exedens]|uniref:Predicted membrane protein n=1 Tax=Nannocystis exedens TaxID=54 RepID=A0A1I1Y3M5_9BACT|nr:DUF2306 domain-containing protein [Nannocystis exedens]PCC71784.1 hypothetical protein NAEX_04863 [Nannocystis exedens]SFE14049.1 Predicted membrane protein [Nannocystis exedens]